MAVFESAHRTADVGSSMDTFLCGQNYGPQLFYGHFFHVHKTAGPRQFYGHFSNPVAKTTKTADLSSIMDTFRLLELIFIRRVHKTAGPRQFYGHIETLVDLGTSMGTELQVLQNCRLTTEKCP